LLSGNDTQGGITRFVQALRAGIEDAGQTCRSVALHQAFISHPDAFDEVLVRQRRLTPWQHAAAVLRLLALVGRERPVAILTVMPLAGVAAALAGWLTGTPVIATHHSLYQENGHLVRWLDTAVGRLGGYRQIVCVSRAVAESFAGHPPAYRARLCVIPNGVAPVMPSANRAQCFGKWGLPVEAPVVVMAGRLARQKNVLTAVRAVAQLEGVHLALAGDGPLRGEVAALARDLGAEKRVHLLGQLSHADVVDLTFAADVFLQISLYEGQSLALLDAVRVATPAVVSDIAVQREVITGPMGMMAGETCDPRDPQAVAQALAQLLHDRARHRQVREALLQLAPLVRSEAQMVADYQEVLAPVLDGGLELVAPPLEVEAAMGKPRNRLLAVSSSGGHWQQLQLLGEAFTDFEVIYASTVFEPRSGLPERQLPLRDVNRNAPWQALPAFWEALALVRRIRPAVIVSTGAGPGLLVLVAGRLLGVHTVWIDSVANAERLSMSGWLARRFVELHCSQWEHLADGARTKFFGRML